jgi:hypothetical protein
VPRSLARALAVASALALATITLSGCTQAPTATTVDDCAGIVSKVLLTDDSATTVAKFTAGDVPKIFNVPGTPAPTCYYSSVDTLPPRAGVVYTQSHRTLLYIGLSDSDAESIIASIRKTVSVKPWTVRFDYGTPTPAAGATATPTAAASTSSSARWYYNFAGPASDDKGEMGYYESTPISQGVALQAGLDKSVNLLRVETELTQVKK